AGRSQERHLSLPTRSERGGRRSAGAIDGLLRPTRSSKDHRGRRHGFGSEFQGHVGDDLHSRWLLRSVQTTLRGSVSRSQEYSAGGSSGGNLDESPEFLLGEPCRVIGMGTRNCSRQDYLLQSVAREKARREGQK